MRFRFRGTRGSLPAPGADTVRFGGNTTCIEVRSDNDDLIILDAGTGIRELGMELVKTPPVNCHLFITHTHWDHIHGLPFFAPMFVPDNSVTVYGPPDPVAMTGIEGALSLQMQYPHFPVSTSELAADVEYTTLVEMETVDLGFALVQPMLLNHPAMNYGYRITCDGRTLFFTGDHEAYSNIYQPDDVEYEEYQRVVNERVRQLEEFITGADVLIADGQYTRDEYVSKQGWGHSAQEDVLELAVRTGIERVFLTHHETSRSDEELDVIERGLKADWEGKGLAVALAREGMEVRV